MFRTGGSAVGEERDGEKLFDDFQRGLRLDDNTSGSDVVGNAGTLEQSWNASQESAGWQSWSLAQMRSFDTYTQLDAPLHESVRNDHSHITNDTTAPRQLPHPPANASLAQSDDIFSLLDAESQSSAPSQPEASLSSAVLSNFSSTYRPPSPSHPSFSREQAALHLSLAEAQSSTQSQRDLVIPRPDNPSTLEGVYAPTPEAALSSIFATTGRDESTDVTETESIDDRGRTVIKKITKHFDASSYIDDVYGISPVLNETIEEVLKPDTTGENREKAVRRLESLWRHISNSGPQNQGADWVDGWLLKNT
ncbi:hypothetical protein PHSY_006485 [Pseudozyma hubeiensis SY62]|uniref:Uncharacterized protein n=1 Tax=Pseudozyma hubeiensis (strain SY62) TaxID=1305764 RepID=R9PLD3_PSEHS|nr:hypothetical protein PHSY_006485 [Pseudozyma hubeiensis SY62]GAC98890.1 hypothetical protein PHSY_006485 [Pseudozyma hubeiensis SY62]